VAFGSSSDVRIGGFSVRMFGFFFGFSSDVLDFFGSSLGLLVVSSVRISLDSSTVFGFLQALGLNLLFLNGSRLILDL
jgi:hypothetical protein